jgi:hypothetical protein
MIIEVHPYRDSEKIGDRRQISPRRIYQNVGLSPNAMPVGNRHGGMMKPRHARQIRGAHLGRLRHEMIDMRGNAGQVHGGIRAPCRSDCRIGVAGLAGE